MDDGGVKMVLETVAKGGIGAVIIATLYGLSLLVTAWRGGSVEQRKQAELVERMKALEAKVGDLESTVEGLEGRLHDMRWQRDQARLRVNFLEMKHGEPLTEYEDKEEA